MACHFAAEARGSQNFRIFLSHDIFICILQIFLVLIASARPIDATDLHQPSNIPPVLLGDAGGPNLYDGVLLQHSATPSFDEHGGYVTANPGQIYDSIGMQPATFGPIMDTGSSAFGDGNYWTTATTAPDPFGMHSGMIASDQLSVPRALHEGSFGQPGLSSDHSHLTPMPTADVSSRNVGEAQFQHSTATPSYGVPFTPAQPRTPVSSLQHALGPFHSTPSTIADDASIVANSNPKYGLAPSAPSRQNVGGAVAPGGDYRQPPGNPPNKSGVSASQSVATTAPHLAYVANLGSHLNPVSSRSVGSSLNKRKREPVGEESRGSDSQPVSKRSKAAFRVLTPLDKTIDKTRKLTDAFFSKEGSAKSRLENMLNVIQEQIDCGYQRDPKMTTGVLHKLLEKIVAGLRDISKERNIVEAEMQLDFFLFWKNVVPNISYWEMEKISNELDKKLGPFCRKSTYRRVELTLKDEIDKLNNTIQLRKEAHKVTKEEKKLGRSAVRDLLCKRNRRSFRVCDSGLFKDAHDILKKPAIGTAEVELLAKIFLEISVLYNLGSRDKNYNDAYTYNIGLLREEIEKRPEFVAGVSH